MKRSEVLNCPFNLSTVIEDDLREHPEDSTQFEKAIQWFEDRTLDFQNEPEILLVILGQLANLERVAYRLNESENHSRKAIALAQANQKKQEAFVNQIRLAICLHWQKRFLEADSLFVSCIRASENEAELKPYVDFAYQNAGKSKFDQNQFEPALRYFEKALLLRRNKPNRDLVEATELAIRITKEKKGHFR